MAAAGAGLATFWATQHSLALRCATGGVLAVCVALGGYKKRSLSVSGAWSAFVVGWVTCTAEFALGVTLIAFFVSSSLLTRVGGGIKRKTDEDYKEGGQRDWVQVVCNGGVPTVLAALFSLLLGGSQPHRMGTAAPLVCACVFAFVGYYACCCGDTWASELGVLSKTPPRLITTLEVVPAGTNGGISVLGTAASAAGGLFVGVSFFVASLLSTQLSSAPWLSWVLPLGVAAGVIGSTIDSLLGATIQFSGYDTVLKKMTGTPGPGVRHISGLRVLNNHAVNFVSALLTAALAGLLGFVGGTPGVAA